MNHLEMSTFPMNPSFELVARSLLIGAGATLALDSWAAVLRRFGIPSLRIEHLGRWIGHLPRGRWRHEDIARAAPVRAEALLGWGAHYAIGVSFAALLLISTGLGWVRSPTLLPPLCVGIVTVLCPWFVLQPAIGAGIASSKTRNPVRNALKSLLTHTVFGIGLFLAAHATAPLLGAGS
jgi:hypothetical protein